MNIKNSLRTRSAYAAAIFAAAAAIFLIARGMTDTAYTTNSYTKTAEALGTVITITLYDTETKPMSDGELSGIADRLFDETLRLEHIFSARLQDSELSRLNDTAADSPVNVSPELFSLMELSLEYCRMSEGALDISIGKLIKLWNIGSDTPHLPDKNEVAPYINRNGWKNIVTDKDDSTVSYTDGTVSADLGAIAKGYVGDVLKNLAEKLGISCAIFNLGGNIVTIGGRYTGGDWNISITDPLSESDYFASLSVNDMAVVTSGNYERYFERDGVRYHHILNPATGFPADNGTVSVTIIGPSSARCDALSTACYIMGRDDGLRLINSLDGYEAVFIDSEGNASLSSGMEKYNYKELSN